MDYKNFKRVVISDCDLEFVEKIITNSYMKEADKKFIMEILEDIKQQNNYYDILINRIKFLEKEV